MSAPVQALKRLIPPELRPDRVADRLLAELAVHQRIVGGPFVGLRHPGRSVGSERWPKQLGTYECELAPLLPRLDQAGFRTVINVGSAEGYYAVGLARRWPPARVIAFELDPTGRDLTAENARINGVADRIEIRAAANPESLVAALRDDSRGLLLMDVEGAEDELLDGPVLPALRDYHVLVELHDIRRERLGERLRARFAATHRIEEIVTRPRRFSDFTYPPNPLLRAYLLRQLIRISDELRGAPMRWFYLTPLPRP